MDHRVFALDSLPLADGGTLPSAGIAYSVHGTLDADGRNAVLCPSYFGGDHTAYDWLIGEGRPLDTRRYCVVTVGLFGNGVSSSPSNHPLGAAFPRISPQDNVDAQYRLLTEELGVTELALVTGWSMGAAHAYQWAVSYPRMVRRIAPFCGSAATSEHNRVFLAALAAALRADGSADGSTDGSPDGGAHRGRRAAGRVFAGWAASHPFWARGCYRELGFASREEYLTGFWEEFFVAGPSTEDLLTMIDTWARADVGATPGFDGRTEAALGSVTAEAVLLPSARDLCFAVEDEARAAALMPRAALRVIPGVWGHLAGAGATAADRAFIGEAITTLLATRPAAV
ncbi:alpha/beta fold hydrolase [Kitasatospora sp. NPDC093550]|uniref:alpha/beta fold hydrolase n=1 Tax=Kitasatospora sp. NPDC093550 TaxID=3364089 RepID=UPI0037FFAC75